MTEAPMNFAFFREGLQIGRQLIEPAPLVDAWDLLFPRDSTAGSEQLPAALLVAILMRGYTMILDRRPPGNVHASQEMIWGVPAARDAPLSVTLTCIEKQLRNDRPWITFAAVIESVTGMHHLDARMRFLWAC